MLKIDEKMPDGKKLLRKLIDLLAEQEGVKITCDIVLKGEDNEKSN